METTTKGSEMSTTTTPTPKSKSDATRENSRFMGTTEFAKSDDGKRRVEIQANSGKPFDHYYWQKFAIDLQGLEIPSQTIPILFDHDTRQVIGQTTKIEVTEEGLMVEGEIYPVPESDRVTQLADLGHEWQASIWAEPKRVERVAEGVTAQVNGYDITGPGHMFAESVLREVTVTVLGADPNTRSALFSLFQHNQTTHTQETAADSADSTMEVSNMGDQDKAERLTLDRLRADHSDLVEKLQAEARDEERDRVRKIFGQAGPGQDKLALELVQDGADYVTALEKLAADSREKLGRAKEQFRAETPEPVSQHFTAEESPEPAAADVTDEDLDLCGVEKQKTPDAERFRRSLLKEWNEIPADKKPNGSFRSFFFYEKRARGVN